MAREKQRVTTRVGEVAYTDRGKGPAALFVHGVFLNSYLWRRVIERVCGERRCIALDLLGHGDTPARREGTSPCAARRNCWRRSARRWASTRSTWLPTTAAGPIAQIFAARRPDGYAP